MQEGFDYVTGKWMEDEQRRLDEGQADENIQSYSKRNGQLMALSDEWTRVDRGRRDSEFEAQAQINRSAVDGMTHARGMSGERLK